MNFFNKFNKLNNHYKDRKFVFLSLFLGLFGIFFVTFGSSYAYLTYQEEAVSENKISAGTLLVKFSDESEGITLDSAVPQTNYDAMENNPEHTFKVSNIGNYDIKYKLSLINTCKIGDTVLIGSEKVIIDKCIPLEYIKVAIKIDDGDYIIKNISDDGSIVLSDMLNLKANSASSNYSIKLWLSLDTPNEYSSILANGDSINSVFTGKVEIYGEQLIENVATGDECFSYDNLGRITEYRCYAGNRYGLSAINYVVIPESINGVSISGIDYKVFNNKNLVEVVIPSSIVEIKDEAFKNNPLTKVIFMGRTDTSGIILADNAFDNQDAFVYIR